MTSHDHGRHLREPLRIFVLALVTALGVYLCYRLTRPFLPAISWALALAILFAPWQRRLEARLRHHNSVAALLAVFVIGLIVVVPATLVGQQLLAQAASGASLIEAKIASGEWRRAVEAQPVLAPLLERLERYLDLPGLVRAMSDKLSGAAGTIVRGSAIQTANFFLIFYLLFFFLRDRASALRGLHALSPLREADMQRLLQRIDDTVHATVYGTLAVAAIQGTLGGLMFWWLGLPAPLLWGVVMTLLAVVPVLGTFVVWIPAALFLALEGSWEKALVLAAWGALVVGTIDNLLRPILVGDRLKMHTVLAFIAMVGGLALFGAAGLIIGPLVLTVTMVLLELWPLQLAQFAANTDDDPPRD